MDLKQYNDNEFEYGLSLSSESVYKAPEFNSSKNKDYVPFLDTDKSQYPDKLIYYKNNSSLHGAILRNIADQVAGNGFVVDGSTLISETEAFLMNISTKDDANEILSKVSDDLSTFKGFTLLVKWSKDGKSIVNIDHMDFSKIRSGVVDDEGNINEYFYSWDWDSQRPKYVVIPAYNTNSMAEKKKAYDIAIEKATNTGKIIPELQAMLTDETEQILYFHPYASNEFYYPLPYYVAATNAINTDVLTDQYGLGAMSNGLSANHIVNFKGNYTPEQKKETGRSFTKTYANSINTGRPVIAFSKPGEDSELDIIAIQSNNKDERYTSINENATQKILSGHGVTSPMLVGIKEAGSLGGGDEIEYLSQLFYRNVIRPKQNAISKVFNNLLDVNQLGNISIERLSPITGNNEIV